jgi:hypothetical protein
MMLYVRTAQLTGRSCCYCCYHYYCCSAVVCPTLPGSAASAMARVHSVLALLFAEQSSLGNDDLKHEGALCARPASI